MTIIKKNKNNPNMTIAEIITVMSKKGESNDVIAKYISEIKELPYEELINKVNADFNGTIEIK